MDTIDFVITWVDQTDKAWQNEKNSYLPDEDKLVDAADARYRDTGCLKYLLRSIELYAPWVNKVFLVTSGHTPSWLNKEHKKLVHVKHEDFMDPAYLPTFSSHPIELNMHKIKGLSQKFVYFNDDFLLSNPVSQEQFFINDLPRDYCVCAPKAPQPSDIYPQLLFNNLKVLNKHFSLKKFRREHFGKYYNYRYKKYILYNLFFHRVCRTNKFVGLMDNHHPQPYLKDTFKIVWDEEEKALHETSLHKFRTPNDLTPYIFRYWQLVTGKFYPVTCTDRKYTSLGGKMSVFEEALFSKKYKFVCLNDTPRVVKYEIQRQKSIEILDRKFPLKSSFEL